ncbi:MAG: chitobiase/beta-hexosaminidase C-terminal domain-containing protein [Candidatus Cloacimonetes bacterium]|nr:chitobiase/beta-hexosaminidase C-terminal domain-containing protein [Candidatus Cloacimonadota bacterium]
MRKTMLIFVLILVSMGLVWGQTTINFDDAAKWTQGSVALTSYAVNHTYVDGIFSATGGAALRNTNATQDGFAGALGTYSWRLSNTATVEWIMTIASGGVSTFSLKARRWDSTPSPDYNLEYSVNGGTDWTLVSVVNNTSLDNVSDWKLFEGTINNAAADIKIRLKANGTTERIMVDDFTWSAYGGTPSPSISVAPSTLTGFAYVTGAGPSTSQSFTISGANLTANINIAASTNFEISETIGSGYTTPIVLTPTGGTVADKTIYVRLKAGLTAGSYSDELITASSTDATDQTVTCSGSVSDPVVPELLLEENFVYTAGTTLTSNGWITHSGTSGYPTVATEGLSYAGYASNSGLAGQTVASGAEDVHLNFTSQTTGSVYTSVLINVSSASEAGDYVYHFSLNGTSITDFKGKLFVARDASNNVRFGLTKSSNVGANGANVAWTGYNYAYGTTYLLVIKYEIVAGATNDVVSLWVNPTIGATEPAALITPSVPTDVDIAAGGVGSICIRQSANTPIARFDGIRVANAWEALWTGEAPTPVITVTGELEPFAAYVNAPSDVIQHYTLSGEDISGNIAVTAPNGFELSLNGIDGWAGSLNLASSFADSIYVRMLASEIREYSGNITHASAGATTVNLPVSGESFPPDATWNITEALTQFSSEAGTPSAAQSYTLSATSATYDLIVKTTAPYQLSANGTTGWADSLAFAYNFNGSVFVRMNSAAAGTFNRTITHNTPGASEAVINITGVATPVAGDYATDLFFSEYIEGSSYNKSIEIFNGTGSTVDLSDYRYENWFNGGSSPNLIPLTGTLAHGDVYVIANPASSAAILALADLQSDNVNFNGDDALVLRKISTDTMVDIFGVIGQDPGTQWTAVGGNTTVNKTLVRKATVTSGITVNPTASVPALVTDFTTLGTEWDQYDIDTITDLAMHTFTPGTGDIVANPTFDPAGGFKLAPVNVTLATTTVGATIRYTLDGTAPNATSTLYTTPINISSDTTLKAIGYKDGFSPSSIVTAVYSFPHDVANIAALRASTTGATVYRVTGEAVLTFQQTTRNQKYIQDSSAAILIDDPSGIITSTYALYDGITGVAGTIALYNGLLQFTPVTNPGTATSNGNTVVPVVRTLATITSDDQAKLIKVLNVTLDSSSGNFTNIAQNITATDASGTITMRTFPATDYSLTAIPVAAQDIIGLAGQYNDAMQFSPRFLADFSEASGTILSPVVTISEAGGTVTLNWAAVDGASTYRIEHSDTPDSGFTLVTTTALLTWNGAATSKKFYRVIAIQ